MELVEKKVLIITHVSGFLLKFERENVRNLQNMGYKVFFASNIREKGYYFEEKELQELGVIFHHVDIAKSPYMVKMNYIALKELRRFIEQEQIQLIHCHTPVGGMLGRLAAQTCSLRKKPHVIYTAHGFHFFKGAPLFNNIVYKMAEYILARMTDAIILINEEDYNNAQKLPIKNKEKIFKIPGVGLDLDEFVPVNAERKTMLRQEHNLSNDIFLVMSVGEVNENKNHIVALEVIAELIKNNSQNSNLRYGICGEGFWDKKIKKYAADLGIQDKVFFWGYQRNIKDYYAMADITLFPSKREGLGMVGIESLAMGIPVVASDNRGTREYMQNGKNGYICDYRDKKAFSDAIMRLKNMAPQEFREMQYFCRKSIKRFDKKYTNKKMQEIYSLIDKEVFGDEKSTYKHYHGNV